MFCRLWFLIIYKPKKLNMELSHHMVYLSFLQSLAGADRMYSFVTPYGYHLLRDTQTACISTLKALHPFQPHKTSSYQDRESWYCGGKQCWQGKLRRDFWLFEMLHKLVEALCVACNADLCWRQDAANGPGKWFSADCCGGPERSGSTPHSPFSVVLQERVRAAAAPIRLIFPQWSDLLRCDCGGEVSGFMLFSGEKRGNVAIRNRPQGQHTHEHANTLCLIARRVDADAGVTLSGLLRCVSFVTFYRVLLLPHHTSLPLWQNENTQVVTGGETMEGKC